MAQKLITGPSSYLVSFSDGQGGGASSYVNYSPDMDINFLAIQASVNQLVDEMRGVAGPNTLLPLDILVLDDPAGVGITTSLVIGVERYKPTFISGSQVDVTAGIAVVASLRVSGIAVSLAPRVGTLDVLWWNYIALDATGAVTINAAANSRTLDLWRIEVNAAGDTFTNNIEKVGPVAWQYGLDGDAWVEMSDATGLGSTDTFPIEPAGVPTGLPYAEPKIRINRIERLLSGFTTDLQATPQTIGPVVTPGGSAATPGVVLGDGAGTNDLTSGFYRAGADRLGYATAGVQSIEVDAAGQLDLPLNFRVKGRRTAAQTLTDASGLVEVVFSAADDFDIGTWHGADADFTVPTDGGGTYIITAAIEWATAITNRRDVRVEIALGGTLITGGQVGARLEIDEDHASTVSVVSVLAAGNVVTVEASHDDVDGALGLDIIDATISIVKVA